MQGNCIRCTDVIKEGEAVYCGICYINKMWEMDSLEEIKKIIDSILERAKAGKKNPYSTKSYEELF